MRTAWRVWVLAGMVGVAGLLLAQQPSTPAAVHWAIEVHGGAGVIQRAALKPEAEAAYRASLAQAAEAGAKVLDQGGSSLDAVEAAIRILEDDPLFNAGRGAVFTAEGKNELDAAIMDGSNLKAGAVAGVTRTRHPISLSRAVMEKSPHVMMIGAGDGMREDPAGVSGRGTADDGRAVFQAGVSVRIRGFGERSIRPHVGGAGRSEE